MTNEVADVTDLKEAINTLHLVVVLLYLCLGGIVLVIILKIVEAMVVNDYLRKAQLFNLKTDVINHRIEESQSHIKSMLTVIKEWAYAARSHYKDSVGKLEETKQIENSYPTRGDVARLVENVPEKTADMVVGRMKKDSKAAAEEDTFEGGK